jgi:hypothetical protein
MQIPTASLTVAKSWLRIVTTAAVRLQAQLLPLHTPHTAVAKTILCNAIALRCGTHLKLYERDGPYGTSNRSWWEGPRLRRAMSAVGGSMGAFVCFFASTREKADGLGKGSGMLGIDECVFVLLGRGCKAKEDRCMSLNGHARTCLPYIFSLSLSRNMPCTFRDSIR